MLGVSHAKVFCFTKLDGPCRQDSVQGGVEVRGSGSDFIAWIVRCVK